MKSNELGQAEGLYQIQNYEANLHTDVKESDSQDLCYESVSLQNSTKETKYNLIVTLQSKADTERKEELIILVSNASVEPLAMMVETLDAFVATPAVLRGS